MRGSFRGELHPRDRRGKFRAKPGDFKLKGRGGQTLTPELAAAAARTSETVRPLDWSAPPPPAGTKRATRGGKGYSSDEAFGTNTTLGRVGEKAFVAIVGGRILHPEGHGEQSPLDVRYDGYGFEVKACSTKAQSFKATPKPYERDQKEAFAQQLGVKPALAIVVVDSESGQAHAYFRDGLGGGRLSARTGWNYLGTCKLSDL